MRALTDRLRDDIDAIDPPTKRAKEAQDYIRITPKVGARQLAELKPDFSLKEFAFVRAQTRTAALNFVGRKTRVETTWLVKYPYYASPYIGVALQDGSDCDEVPRLGRLKEWR